MGQCKESNQPMTEPTSEHHLYERIAAALRDEILARTRAPGERLPTQEELGETFGASRIAVRRALDLLESEGLIDRVQGGRATVRLYDPLVRRSALHYRTNPGMPFAEEALKTERTPTYDYDTAPERAGLETARRLQISVGDEVMRTRYVSYVNGEPIQIVTSYEPLALTRGTPIEHPEQGPLMAAGIVDRFTSIGFRPSNVTERLHARMPRPSEAEQLRLRPGIPVIVAVRVCYAGERPIETADLLFAGNQFKLEYSLAVEPAP